MPNDRPLDWDRIPALKTYAKREDFAEDTVDWANAWFEYIATLNPRWKQLEDMLANKPTARELPWEGASNRNFPIFSSKSWAWLDDVCNPPIEANPPLTGTIFGKDAPRARAIEKDFSYFMKKGGWARAFRMVTLNAGYMGVGWWRVRVEYSKKNRPEFCYESVSPRKMIVYPNTAIEAAVMIGHQYEESLAEIKRKRKSKEYWDDKQAPQITSGSDRPNEPANDLVNNSESIAKEDVNMPVISYEVLRWVDLGERELIRRKIEATDISPAEPAVYGELLGEQWYRCRVAAKDKVLLGVYEYPYQDPWYFPQYVREEEGKVQPNRSKLGGLQDLQVNLNDTMNLALDGAKMNAFPIHFLSGWSVRKFGRAKPGSMITMPVGGQVSTVQSNANIMGLLNIEGIIDREAGETMRLGAQQTAGATTGDQTALAAQIRQKASDSATSGDLQNIDECQGAIGEFMQDCYRIHWHDFHVSYGDKLSTQPDPGKEDSEPEILNELISWSLTGKNPTLTPQAQYQAAMGVVQAITPLANPEIAQALQSLGVDVGELVGTIIANSSLENAETIYKKPEGGVQMPAPTGMPNIQPNPTLSGTMPALSPPDGGNPVA